MSGRILGSLRSQFQLASYTLAIAIMLVFIAGIDFDEVWRNIRAAEIPWVLLALTLNLPVVLLMSVRSRLVMAHMGYQIPFAQVVPITIVGHILGSLTPAGTGDLYRAHLYQDRGLLTTADGVTLVLFERSLSLYLLVASTILAWLLSGDTILLFVAACAAACFLPWITSCLLGRFWYSGESLSEASGFGKRLWRRVVGTARQARRLLSSLRLVLTWSFLTLAVFAVTTVQVFAVSRSIGSGLSILDSWTALGGSTLLAIVTMIPFGIGLSDASMGAIVTRFGLTLEEGSVVALLSRVTITLPLVLIAFLGHLYLVRSRSTLNLTPRAKALYEPPAG